jgi:hypothetical protein
MTRHRTVDVPHVDDDMDPSVVKRMAERIAVPNFDWVGGPIGAVVDGLSGHAHDAEDDDTDG